MERFDSVHTLALQTAVSQSHPHHLHSSDGNVPWNDRHGCKPVSIGHPVATWCGTGI